MNITAIILAAGESKRFGENKLLLTYHNETFIDIIIKKVIDVNFSQIIVVAKDIEVIEIAKKYPVEIIINNKREIGQSTSIVEGVKAANKQNDLMFFVGDQPFLSKNTINKIIEYHLVNKEMIIVPLYNDKKGNPVIFPCFFRNSLLKLTGNSGGRTIISNSQNVKYLNLSDEFEHMDIDLKEDYEKMKAKEICYNGYYYSDFVIVRGGGDLASGIIQKLHRTGFKVLVLEIENPSAIRRTVSFSNAIYDCETSVEGITSKLAKSVEEISKCINEGIIPIYIDPYCKILETLKPFCIIDCIIAKKNLGTNKEMAPITIALGPGFDASKDVDIVVETMRGHNLGRLIFEGVAAENTGEPGIIDGVSKERVMYSPCDGNLKKVKNIGDIVKKEEVIAYIGDTPLHASIDGVLRGMLPENFKVYKGLKTADIDPRISEKENCFTISDKSRALGGAVLEALFILINGKLKKI